MRRPFGEPLGKAVRAKRHRFDRLIVGEHGDRNLGAARRLRRSSGDPRTFRMERRGWFRTPVPRDYLVPMLDEVARHAAAHPAKSEECNIHGLTPLSAIESKRRMAPSVPASGREGN